jgi:uncharacterized protein
MTAPQPAAAEFRPHRLLKTHMVQSILATKRPARAQWTRRGNRMEAVSQMHTLDCGAGVRLTGLYAPQPAGTAPRGLALMIHGWEGSHNSVYLYSMSCRLYQAGWNIFRLNLRDHGDTHHLNEALFHSARMDEVFGAIRAVQQLDGPNRLAVIGFSLGGNFALRVGVQGPAAGIHPELSIGISPVFNPGNTLAAIDRGPLVFSRYFRDKWRKTLKTKAQAWPGRYDFAPYKKIDRFVEITRRFVTDFTEYARYEDYLAAYTLTPEMLMNAASPVAVLTAQDDAIIPFEDFHGLAAAGSVIAFDAPKHGGHCGFIENFAMESWAERRVLALLGPVNTYAVAAL